MQQEESLKLIGLQIYGLRKIRAFSMQFAENGLIEFVGKNGHGKTTTLNAIEILLKGLSALPKDAISHDAEKLEIIGKVGDYTIRRIFSKERTQTTFQVSKDNFVLKEKPQAFLDTFINDVTFNPMPFINKKPEEKLKFLMDFIGIDFTQTDAKIATLMAERTYVGRERDAFGEIIIPEKVEPVSLSELNAELDKIDIENDKLKKDYEKRQREALDVIIRYNNEQRTRQGLFDYVTKLLTNINSQIEGIDNMIKSGLKDGTPDSLGNTREVTLEDYEISTLVEKRTCLQIGSQAFTECMEAFTKPLELKPEVVSIEEPKYEDKTSVRQKIANSEDTNRLAQAYSDAILKQQQKAAKQKEYDDKTAEIERLRDGKKKQLIEAKLPIEGIELREDGVYYNGIFSENWSGAESFIISAKICMSKNPKLKAVFYDNGAELDTINRKIVNDWCLKNGIQFMIARVADVDTDNDDPNVFYIEEGEVLDTPAAIKSKEAAKEVFPEQQKKATDAIKVGIPTAKKKENAAIHSPEQFNEISEAENQEPFPVEELKMGIDMPKEEPIREVKIPEPKGRAVDPNDLFGGGK